MESYMLCIVSGKFLLVHLEDIIEISMQFVEGWISHCSGHITNYSKVLQIFVQRIVRVSD